MFANNKMTSLETTSSNGLMYRVGLFVIYKLIKSWLDCRQCYLQWRTNTYAASVFCLDNAQRRKKFHRGTSKEMEGELSRQFLLLHVSKMRLAMTWFGKASSMLHQDPDPTVYLTKWHSNQLLKLWMDFESIQFLPSDHILAESKTWNSQSNQSTKLLRPLWLLLIEYWSVPLSVLKRQSNFSTLNFLIF